MKRIFVTIAAACLIIAAASIAQMIKPGGGSGGGGTTYTATSPIDITGTVVSCPTCSVTAPALIGPLDSCIASSVASCDLDGWYSASYNEYEIQINGLRAANDSVVPRLRFSTDGGSTYDTGANYAHTTLGTSSGGVGQDASATDHVRLISGGAQDNGNAAYASDWTLRLKNPGGTTYRKWVMGPGAFWADANVLVGVSVYGSYNSASAVNAFQVSFSSGNIATGSIYVYAIAR